MSRLDNYEVLKRNMLFQEALAIIKNALADSPVLP